jgi:hypothetical protein
MEIPRSASSSGIVDRQPPQRILAEQLTIAHMADIDVVEARLLLDAVELELDEAAGVRRNASRIIGGRLIERDIVVDAKAGRRPARLRHSRVGEGRDRGKCQRQAVILAVAADIAVELEVAPCGREVRAERSDMAVGAGLAGLHRERRHGERRPRSKRGKQQQDRKLAKSDGCPPPAIGAQSDRA